MPSHTEPASTQDKTPFRQTVQVKGVYLSGSLSREEDIPPPRTVGRYTRQTVRRVRHADGTERELAPWQEGRFFGVKFKEGDRSIVAVEFVKFGWYTLVSTGFYQEADRVGG